MAPTAGITVEKSSVPQSSDGMLKICVSPFDFSRDWKNDKKVIMALEREAYPKELRCTSKEISGRLIDASALAVVARDADGRIIGMASGRYLPSVVREYEDARANGGERESFDELHEVIKGAVGEVPMEKVFYVDAITVLPDFQKRRVGTNLALGLLSSAKEKGYVVFACHAMTGTGSARLFENELGASKIKDYPRWYGGDDAACLLVKSLSGKTLNVPHAAQTMDYNCGPAALQVLLYFYGVHESHKALEELCSTTEKHGTFPEGMVSAIETLGFSPESKQDATVDDLIRKIDKGDPAIVLYTLHYLPGLSDEAPALWYVWKSISRHYSLSSSELKDAFRYFEESHYSLIIGYDDKDFVLMDIATGMEERCPKDEFNRMWHGKVGSQTFNKWMLSMSAPASP
jgi:predicted double-glycine peptidase/GNAT superfamily N-acetyltransferase